MDLYKFCVTHRKAITIRATDARSSGPITCAMRMAAHTELWCGSSIASHTGWLRMTGFAPVGARDGQSPTFLSLLYMSRTRQTPTVRTTPVLPAPSRCMHQYENRQYAQGILATRCLKLSCSSFNKRIGSDKLINYSKAVVDTYVWLMQHTAAIPLWV